MNNVMTWILFSFAIVAAPVMAQDLPPLPKPEKEHIWLKQFEGEWTVESEGVMGPGQPAIQCKGTTSARMLGEFWVVVNITSEMPGMKIQGLQTIGYDTAKKKFVGTWVDSMLNHMWKYEGWIDDTGLKLTLEAEGPNFTQEGKTAKFRDIYEFKTPDHYLMFSQMQGDDGQWIEFMKGSVHRKK